MIVTLNNLEYEKFILKVLLMKKCTKCHENKELSNFYKNKNSRDGLTSHCKKCMHAYNKEWQKKNVEKCSRYTLNWHKKNKRRVYSHQLNRFWPELSPEERLRKYDSMHEKQNGLCAICHKKRKLGVDHCHKTGKVRGLLCSRCNFGIGSLQDDTGNLARAIEYLS